MHLLVASGGSTHSHIALQQCLAIAEMVAVEATILTVIEHEEDQSEAEDLISAASAILSPVVHALRSKIRVGQPDTEIVAEAASDKYDLLILGEKSQHSLLTRLMGPTAQRVIAQSERPVLLAKLNAHAPQRILICDGGAQTPNLPERLGAQLPELLAVAEDVTVLHVMSQISAAPGVAGQDLRAGAKDLIKAETPEGDLLAQDLQALEQIEVAAKPKVRHGLVVDEILTEASDGSYDLVVIGAHAQEGWQRFLLENVATQIVLQVDRPVLIIP